MKFDSILFVSFGGPERRDDVMPFLRNVVRGKRVPDERLDEVAQHYYDLDGVSPLNQQNRELIELVGHELRSQAIDLPIFFGNRNWHPLLNDTLSEMVDQGLCKALAFVTSGFSCYSGCRQYRENIFEAQQSVGTKAPVVEKIRVFYNHPLFIEGICDRIENAVGSTNVLTDDRTRLVFTAHSIPKAMADNSDYVKQLSETCSLVAQFLDVPIWDLVYQSRSGPPQQPWLEPDVVDHMHTIKQLGVEQVVMYPVGFLSDHVEVLFDLDYEVKQTCTEIGLDLIRVKTIGSHPKFVEMVCELIAERVLGKNKRATGKFPPNHDTCPSDCCLSGQPGAISPV